MCNLKPPSGGFFIAKDRPKAILPFNLFVIPHEFIVLRFGIFAKTFPMKY